jgi:hypothetical protein
MRNLRQLTASSTTSAENYSGRIGKVVGGAQGSVVIEGSTTDVDVTFVTESYASARRYVDVRGWLALGLPAKNRVDAVILVVRVEVVAVADELVGGRDLNEGNKEEDEWYQWRFHCGDGWRHC